MDINSADNIDSKISQNSEKFSHFLETGLYSGFFREKNIVDGVDFSYIQIEKVLSDRTNDKKIEFETFSPYLCDYNLKTGEIWEDKLIGEDLVGLHLGKLFRKIFPKARLVLFFDTYNTNIPEDSDFFGKPIPGGKQISISPEIEEKFKNNSLELQKKFGNIRKTDVEGKDYLCVSESKKARDAELMVNKLEKIGLIERNGLEINFINRPGGNPCYKTINLRTKSGRWLCEALDAASYLEAENLGITHLIVLPDIYIEQQNKVWEILGCLGMKPLNYHNIFYDRTKAPEKIVETVETIFKKYQGKL